MTASELIDPKIEREPYDPNTPRLNWDQVAVCVIGLPDIAIARLAHGPIEVSGMCGVCNALEDLECEEAALLQAWHDDLSVSERFQDTLAKRVIHPESHDFMVEEIHQIFGALMYARCSAIYAFATVELNMRRKENP